MSLRPLIDLVVTRVRRVSSRVMELELHSPDGRSLPQWEAGAHIEIRVNDALTGPLVRHYSLLGATSGRLADDDPRDCWRIAIQRGRPGGAAEQLQQRLRPGQRLQASTPQNLFVLERHDPFALLVAGGIGVTPIHAMTRSLLKRRRAFAVFYVGRAIEDMAYHNELAALAGERLHCHPTSQAGRPDLLALLKRQPDGTRVYCCGPVSLIQSVERAAAVLGWSPDRVRSEHFTAVSPGMSEKPFHPNLRRSQLTLRVAAGQSILDVVGAARVDVLADCRRGECGLCVQTVLHTDGALDHRDSYLSVEERAEGRSLCICVSRTQGDHLELDL